MKRIALIVLGPLSAVLPLVGRAASTEDSRLQTAVEKYAHEHSFNGTIEIEEDNNVVYRQSFGMADRAFHVPCAVDTKYEIASITKAFTSVLILQLVEEKKVDLNASIKAYLPNYSGEGGSKVTIEDLLNHTSGLPNLDAGYTSADDAISRGMPQYQTYATPEELVSRFYSGKLLHAPGTTFDYNNADYIVLGRIIEVVTGKSFESVLKDKILDRLGMHSTGLLHQENILDNLAPCYFSKDGTPNLINQPLTYVQDWYAAGGMYSTVGDLMAFADALYGGKMLNQRFLDLMLKPGLDGYGYGLWIGSQKFGGKSYRNVNRPGRIMGATGSFYHFNGDGFEKTVNIVILSNTNLTDMDGFSWEIGKTLLE